MRRTASDKSVWRNAASCSAAGGRATKQPRRRSLSPAGAGSNLGRSLLWSAVALFRAKPKDTAAALKAVLPFTKDPSLKCQAVRFLREAGPAAKPFVPELLPLLYEKEDFLRLEVVEILWAQPGRRCQRT